MFLRTGLDRCLHERLDGNLRTTAETGLETRTDVIYPGAWRSTTNDGSVRVEYTSAAPSSAPTGQVSAAREHAQRLLGDTVFGLAACAKEIVMLNRFNNSLRAFLLAEIDTFHIGQMG